MEVNKFIKELKKINLDSFFGVPDSLMSDLSKYLEFDNDEEIKHVITQNEGSAIGMAIGNFLSTKKPSVVYLQNSGLGNIINPLTSLASEKVFSIPVLLIIGWRGEPDTKDEPQHDFQGEITLEQLKLLNIDYMILNANDSIDFKQIKQTLDNNKSMALIIKKDYFKKDTRNFDNNINKLSRVQVIKFLLEKYSKETIFVSTTGKTSRELYELNKIYKRKTFYCIGGMGHASSVAAGIALNNPGKTIVCLDGDGSSLMHMGFLPIVGSLNFKNFHHYVLNNYSHESVGGQPTVGSEIHFDQISVGSNYDQYHKCKNLDDLQKIFEKKQFFNSTFFIEVLINTQSDPNLPRPDKKPIEYLDFFN